MPPTQHARLSASSAHRWMNCAGSVRMSEGLTDPETHYQLEGRAAHALAEFALKNPGADWPTEVVIDSKDGPKTKTWPVDDEMREAVQLYGETVRAIYYTRAAREEDSACLYVEQTLDLGIIRPPESMFGTADAVIVTTTTIDVIDLKYGSGVVVEAGDNEQLLYYALGAILAEFVRRVVQGEMPDDGESVLRAATKAFREVRVTVVQPRAPHTDGPVRTSLTFSGAEVEAFAEHLLLRASATQAADAPLSAGAWCRFCPARGHCPELAAHAKLVAQTDFESVPLEAPPNVEHMPIARVAEMLKGVEVLEMFVRAMVERVTRELEAGREVPGWKMVAKKPRRVWNNAEDVQVWATESGLEWEDTHEPATLKSPAQIEKTIGRANLPDALYSRVSSGLTLVPDSDPRPAAAVGPAEDFLQLPLPQEEQP